MRKIPLLLIIAFALVSCHSSKHTQQTTAKVDSSAIKELQRKLDEATIRYQHAERILREQQYAGVQFDTVSVPVHDTVIGKCPQNTIDITPDGGIHAQGNIRSAFVNKERYEKQITDLRDSLHRAQDELATEKKNVKIEVKEKQVQVKSGVPYFWLWFWVIVAFAAGIAIRHYVWPWLKITLFPIIKR